MAESPSDLSPSRTPPQSGSDPDSFQYWCYHCDKRVAVETLDDLSDVVCSECKNGFVESISSGAVNPPSAASDPVYDPTLGNQFIQVIRLIAQASREQNAPPPPPSDPSDDDYLRVELDEWDEEDEEEDEDEQSVVVVHDEEEGGENREQYSENNGSDGDEEEENEVIETRGEDEGDEMRRRRHDALRLRLRDFATRAGSRRNRILDWAEILMGLEDHSIELRLQVPDSDTYVGNPGDYVDDAGYEALLQNLADSDGGRRGAPPASKSAVEKLESVVIGKEEEVMACAICKDFVNVGEVAKNMPCGHGYHGECIVTWLLSRNSCPVCRFELSTDDQEYEDERKKSLSAANLTVASTSSSAGDDEPGLQ